MAFHSIDVDKLAREIAVSVRQLLETSTSGHEGFQLECNLVSNYPGTQCRKVASIDIATILRQTPGNGNNAGIDEADPSSNPHNGYEASVSPTNTARGRPSSALAPTSDHNARPAKRRAIGGLSLTTSAATKPSTAVRRLESDVRFFPQRKKRLPDTPSLQPSTFSKFINGIWESIFSGNRLDPGEVIEQWQAIELGGQPRLLTDTETGLQNHSDSLVLEKFGKMTVLARKITQTSKVCRSLEVIVQAHWVDAFDDRVAELSMTTSKEKAKKTALSEACTHFGWSDKEIRNRMAVWRGYAEIKRAGGWAALVFAGMGLYRFAKYRVAFTEETFSTLRALKHRFEVAADTLHPTWRTLLAIAGESTERIYEGHPHDWVVCGPGNQALPLASTYHKWDANFTYQHLEECTINEEVWGLFDPRTVTTSLNADPAGASQTCCLACGEIQADEPHTNHCMCFPNLFGGAKLPGNVAVQVFQTANGKNNGLLACCAFERGASVGEFVGEITSGLSNLDVMVGETDKAAYQIWQGKQGNHTKFINHSCSPNSQFERFIWRGTQRIVLVSKGIEAGEEITVDYSDTYWRDLDKVCKCASTKCRYQRRATALAEIT
ncbi:related to SET domain protein [Ramularia collo-cygni]|uniref:Related to SET domain protein n=1 Tax=Ramularia collo-cygni TaxID=112498 RepID=A0A2D3VQS1_9PEZI|nr:related to SET domain protein [Ramularia collo-cygni]CZT24528.1 related to SET domain protein [Ramularia collo-cygni]